MGRDTEEAVAIARQRLELLGQELGHSGIHPRVATPNLSSENKPEAPQPGLIPEPPGRHTRRRGPGWLTRGRAWGEDRLPATLRGRISLRPSSVLLLVLIGVLAILAAWFAYQRMGGQVQVVPDARLTAPAPTLRSSEQPTVAAAADPGGSVVIDVAGKVRRPGVVTLPTGSRVVDAIAAAGGVRPGTNTGDLNQARVLVDGEQIYVGKPPGGLAAAAVTKPGAPASANLVSLNTATQEQLETLPGVGPVTAQSILAWRTAHGSFSSVDELLEVDGIGDKTLAKLAPYVTL